MRSRLAAGLAAAACAFTLSAPPAAACRDAVFCYDRAPTNCIDGATLPSAAAEAVCAAPLQSVRECLAQAVRDCGPASESGGPEALVGVEWVGRGDQGTAYIFRFLPDGVVDYNNASGRWRTGRWVRSDDLIVVSMNDGYATYFMSINGDKIIGSAVNVNGLIWRYGFERSR